MPGRRWTEQDDASLRQTYARGGSLVVLGSKLKRTRPALHHRARALGLTYPANTPWTPEQDRKLTALIEDGYGPRVLRDAFRGRSAAAVYRRRQLLGHTGVPQGHTSVQALAEELDVAFVTVRRALAWAGLRGIQYAGPFTLKLTRGGRVVHYDLDDARDAVTAYRGAATTGRLARVLGIDKKDVWKALVRAGLYPPNAGVGRRPRFRWPEAANALAPVCQRLGTTPAGLLAKAVRMKLAPESVLAPEVNAKDNGAVISDERFINVQDVAPARRGMAQAAHENTAESAAPRMCAEAPTSGRKSTRAPTTDRTRRGAA